MPLAITYGMSVKEFWEDNPDLFWAYRFSYYTNKKLEQEEMNYRLWLQGVYFHEAVAVALANSFGKGKKISYTQKPYTLTKEDEEREIEEQKKKLERQIRNRISQVQAILGKNEKEALPNQKGEGGETQ